ncbi:MAG: hypothetical protein COT73_04650 [Bdellovibrio sp. CG10_big_fil_rev_8_21_14_0_10_47_8]|nr:MAG: hypothetical protein COT73_04650 [Bdellovibrio sp. CG10_big_fil_rev_8_21_14_0_10_47_8]
MKPFFSKIAAVALVLASVSAHADIPCEQEALTVAKFVIAQKGKAAWAGKHGARVENIQGRPEQTLNQDGSLKSIQYSYLASINVADFTINVKLDSSCGFESAEAIEAGGRQ